MGDSRRRIRHTRLSLAILAAGVLTILYTTLRPFNFQLLTLTTSDYIAGFVLPSSSMADFLRNVVLFMPLGFGLAAILDQRGWSKNRIRIAVLLCGLLLTLAVESLQQFVPRRQPSVGDLIANTLGAIVGLACYRLWQNRESVSEWLGEAADVPKKILAALAIYVVFMLIMAYGLAGDAQLRGWDTDYRMMIGNEQSGRRRWFGSAGDLVVYDWSLEPGLARELLSDPELALANRDGLLAYYPLAGGVTQPDVTGNQPDLVWRPALAAEGEEHAALLGGDNWLETASSVKDLSERLQDTSQFSIRLSAATASLDQVGPARIVSISEDPFLRNLTVGQQDTDLILRYRSSLTGENGTEPEILFSDFFTDLAPVDLMISFDGLSVELIDSRSETVQTVEIVPGAAFYYMLLHPIVPQNPLAGQVPAETVYNWAYRVLFYTAVLLPVGFLLSPLALRTWTWRNRLVLIAGSLLAIPFMLEWALVVRSGQGLRPINVVTSVLVIGVVAWVFIPLSWQLFGKLKRAYLQ